MKPLTVFLIALWICTSWVSIDSIASGRPKPVKKPGKSTALHKAAKIGDIKKVKALLAAGAKVNAKGGFGQTPLHLAARRGHTETVKVLLAAGAELNARDKGGETSLDWTKARRTWIDAKEQDKCTQLLRKHGAKYGAELDAEAKQGKQE